MSASQSDVTHSKDYETRADIFVRENNEKKKFGIITQIS